MNRSDWNEVSRTLIARAEHDCVEHDPEMTDSAAMVLVGDIYALLVADEELQPAAKAPAATRHSNDSVTPFIR